ncbi:MULTISPECIES: phytase [Tenacibaculum]|uniref:phytase n=1 Tax=Tenacibaculum TaxID=104267 RepID=UPI0021AFCBAE|nr:MULTISPECIES: phytase [Tenacibaculum]MCT4698106.1 phytase [Tenacibaculum haliotis]WBX71434.1 phytase [Tenacibaculum retecalamus]
MKKIISLSMVCVILASCKVTKILHTNPQLKPVIAITANAETTPVTSFNDAADDPCIWINPNNVMQSVIIGTNKKEGLETYNLDGKRLATYKIGRINNVDIRNGFVLNGKTVSIVTGSNRTYNTLSILIVKENGELQDIAARTIKSTLKEVYGLGMYKSTKTNTFYVFIVGKRGGVEQWELFEKNGKIDAKIVRNIILGGQGEGIVADDFHGKVYIGQEDKALWKYDAEPNSSNIRVKIIGTRDLNMKSDFEGVTLYDSGNGKGYILLSSQGNNSYAVFDRISNQYLGSFSLKDGIVDGTNDTDGIDVTSISFGDKYPKGFFLAQDGTNNTAKDSLAQNFKIVDWKKIERALNLK